MIQAIKMDTADVITPQQPSYSDVTMNQVGDVISSNATSPSSTTHLSPHSYQSPFFQLPPNHHNKFSPATASFPSNACDVRFPSGVGGEVPGYKMDNGGYFPPPPFTPPQTSSIPQQPTQLLVS